jgi:hypothetical protein
MNKITLNATTSKLSIKDLKAGTIFKSKDSGEWYMRVQTFDKFGNGYITSVVRLSDGMCLDDNTLKGSNVTELGKGETITLSKGDKANDYAGAAYLCGSAIGII